MTNSFLSELISDLDDFTIRVRLCTMWDAIKSKKNGELISMDMIFIDEKVLIILILIFQMHIIFESFNFQIT